MRRLLPPLVGLLLLVGCRTFVGPFAHRQPQRVDDPHLSIAEQEQRGRDRLALPEESATVAPPLFTENPSVRGGIVSPSGR